jgi:hypothetical protein
MITDTMSRNRPPESSLKILQLLRRLHLSKRFWK